jgi:prepilin-type N-terminal cleavage/methylation domain-containing protein
MHAVESSVMQRRRQGGFTLLEVMITCAIIAILASVVVPSLFDDGHKTRGISEVQTVFSDLRSRMDQYAMENGAYPTSIGEGTFHPSAPVPSGSPISPMPTAWTAAKIRLTNPSQEVSCAYTWVTGAKSDSSAIGTIAQTRFGFTTAPAAAWYYLLAWCDFDDNSTVDSYYFSSSVDPTILKVDEGS